MIKTATIYFLLDYCINLLDMNITFEMVNSEIINRLIELDPSISKWLPVLRSEICNAPPERWDLLSASLERQAKYNSRTEYNIRAEYNILYSLIMEDVIPLIVRVFGTNPLYCADKYSPKFAFSLNINDFPFFTQYDFVSIIDHEITKFIKLNGNYTNGIFIEINGSMFNIYT